MSQTRREFLVTSAAALCATAATTTLDLAAASPAATIEESSPPGVDWIYGDPYIASADHPGLGARTFDEAREAALRFRTTEEERHRYVLGLEV